MLQLLKSESICAREVGEKCGKWERSIPSSCYFSAPKANGRRHGLMVNVMSTKWWMWLVEESWRIPCTSYFNLFAFYLRWVAPHGCHIMVHAMEVTTNAFSTLLCFFSFSLSFLLYQLLLKYLKQGQTISIPLHKGDKITSNAK